MIEAADERLFSYGTLQLESVQLSTFGRLLDGRADALGGFTRGLVRITDPHILARSGEAMHPILTPSDDPSDEVAGMVFQVTPSELAQPDRYEVSDYARVAVTLRSGARAWV